MSEWCSYIFRAAHRRAVAQLFRLICSEMSHVLWISINFSSKDIAPSKKKKSWGISTKVNLNFSSGTALTFVFYHTLISPLFIITCHAEHVCHYSPICRELTSSPTALLKDCWEKSISHVPSGNLNPLPACQPTARPRSSSHYKISVELTAGPAPNTLADWPNVTWAIRRCWGGD